MLLSAPVHEFLVDRRINDNLQFFSYISIHMRFLPFIFVMSIACVFHYCLNTCVC